MGKRHLEAAISSSPELQGTVVRVHWLPFLLNQNTPEEGYDLRDYLAMKYGPDVAEKFGVPDNPLNSAGRKVGINFNLSRRIINTVAAHALVEHVMTSDIEKTNDLMEAMFVAYFEEAKDLSKVEELQSVGRVIGLCSETVKNVVTSNASKTAVLRKVRETQHAYRVRGVPFFLVEPIDGGRPIAFSGAQPPEIIAEQLVEASGR